MVEGDRNRPVDPETSLHRANLHRVRGEWSEAVDVCVRVLRANPSNVDAHSLLGDIHRDQGAIDDAIQWYRMAADLKPNGADVAKLQALETQRERLGGKSVSLSPATLSPETSTGTSVLLGKSPKLWLSVMTVGSVAFLGAMLLVLVLLRGSNIHAGSNIPRSVDLNSNPSPSAVEDPSGTRIVDPNRPTTTPNGLPGRAAMDTHTTGSGLGADSSVSLGPASPPQSDRPTPDRQQVNAIPPAPVQVYRIPADRIAQPSETAPQSDRSERQPDSGTQKSSNEPSSSPNGSETEIQGNGGEDSNTNSADRGSKDG